MRLLPWLVLAISLALASTAEARLFWQTFGSTVPAADGCGCTWNMNQDYFVPRYSSTGRYGLYGACKSSRSTSPACKTCHPFYPGYCGIYGPCHYRRRNHVYSAYCGCSPLLLGNSCGSLASNCASGAGICGVNCCDPVAPLYNVEHSHLDILGSIPVEGSGLLTQTDFSQLGNPGGGLLPALPQNPLPQQQTNPLLQNLPQFLQSIPQP